MMGSAVDDGNELGIPGLTDLERIEVGGTAMVYRARDVRHSRAVAVKVLNTKKLDAPAHLAFEREVAAMGLLSAHPNIIDLYDSGTTSGQRPYIVMPYYRRGNYAAAVDENGPLPWSELLDFGVKIAAALETAHRQEFVHRDVKPANIFLGDYDRHPVLADFGISSFAAPSLEGTPTVEISTTPIYAAPEVLEADRPGVLSDIYSLGATLFALAEGQPAFSNTSMEVVVYQVTSAKSPPRPTAAMPETLADLIADMMQPNPDRRPPSALRVAERLVEIQKTADLDPTPIVVGPSPGAATKADAPAETETEPSEFQFESTRSQGRSGHDGPAARPLNQPTRSVSALDRPTEPVSELPDPPRPSRIGPPRARPGWGIAVALAAAALVVAVGYAAVTGSFGLEKTDSEELAVLADSSSEQARRQQVERWAAVGGTEDQWSAHSPSWATDVMWAPSADGDVDVLATAGNDGVIRLWTAGNQSALDEIRLPDWIIDIAWSPDGSTLAAALVDGSLHLLALDGNPGSDGPTFDRGATTVIGSAHPGGSEAVAWSPSGDRLVSGGVDARVRLWSAGGEPLADLSGHEGTVLSADWSSDGRRIATSGKDGRVIVWDPAQTAMVAGTEAQPQWSRAVEWVVDSRLLVTIEEPGQVAIWSLSEDGDGPTLTELNRFDVGSAPLEFDVSATPAPMLATVHEGGLVQISDLVSGQLVAEPDGVGDSDAVGVDWLAEGAALAVVDLDGSARLWRPDQGGG